MPELLSSKSTDARRAAQKRKEISTTDLSSVVSIVALAKLEASERRMDERGLRGFFRQDEQDSQGVLPGNPVDRVRMFAQKLAEVRRDTLDDRVNGINLAVRRQNGITRDKVEHQQAFPLGIISSIR